MDFEAIYKAYKKCSKGKRKSSDCARFESRLGEELFFLYRDINNETYNPSQGRCFIVEQPKVREIWASRFRDRVVHHLIVNPLEKIWEPKFHPKSFACRKGKGLHAAIIDFKKQVRRISQGGMKTVFTLQVDIASFFFTIDREILKNLFLQEIKSPEIIKLIEILFATDPRHDFKKVGDLRLFNSVAKEKSWHTRDKTQGIPIGNLTSQFGANLYLNALDHFVTRSLKPKGYLRYMDDLTLLDTDKEKLEKLESVINDWLIKNRKQTLNPSKTVLKPLTEGIEYLGFRLKQVDSAKNPLLVLPTPPKKWKLIQEARRLEKCNLDPILPHEIGFPLHHKRRQELQKLNSRLGLMTHTSSFRFRKNTIKKLHHRLKQNNPDSPLTIGRGYGSIKL